MDSPLLIWPNRTNLGTNRTPQLDKFFMRRERIMSITPIEKVRFDGRGIPDSDYAQEAISDGR